MKKLFAVMIALLLVMSFAMAETLPMFTLQPALEENAEAAEPEATEEPEPYYILPESDVRLITAEELEGVDLEALGYMRNEILARHGYPFKKPHYQEYFRSQIWYVENPDFEYGMLSSIEMENVETIKKMEEKAK